VSGTSSNIKNPFENWPTRGDGTPEPPAHLVNCVGMDLDQTITTTMLESFGIPYLLYSQIKSSAGKTIVGCIAQNGDIYVPESLRDTALALLNGGDEMNSSDLYELWLDSPALSETEKAELRSVAGDEKEIESRFYAPLEFGTAGLRGIMGVGLNRMNIHIIRHATQAFADVINGEPALAKHGVVICYDCRNNSREFAREAACVMAANNIPVRLFSDMRPTPELSFAIREYGAAAGINVTASHNPKEYNGYKVYWSDGAQLPPQHADAIAKRMSEIDIFLGIETDDFDLLVKKGKIKYLGEETDEAFLAEVLAQSIDREVVAQNADSLKIVYTPFHGTGRLLVPEALKRLGVKHIFPVAEQMLPDGDFPTVKSPNPEEPAGFALAIDLAKRENSALIIGTDPDADRVGVMALGADGEYHTISGNQMGVLLLDYIITAKKRLNAMPQKPAALKTIVTTEMARAVAERNGVYIEDTFTGFKFMAEKLLEYEKEHSYNYIFAYEESYGYMTGNYVRDKDAVTASMLIAEMAAYYHTKNMTLIDAMDALYVKYGCYGERTLNLVMPGLDGLGKMRELMKTLREAPPSDIYGTAVTRVRDYQSGEIKAPNGEVTGKTRIRGSNVLYFELADGGVIIVRPSGTEPKIKVYIMVKAADKAEREEKLALLQKYADENWRA